MNRTPTTVRHIAPSSPRMLVPPTTTPAGCLRVAAAGVHVAAGRGPGQHDGQDIDGRLEGMKVQARPAAWLELADGQVGVHRAGVAADQAGARVACRGSAVAGGRLGEVPVDVPDMVHVAPPAPGTTLVILNIMVKITKQLGETQVSNVVLTPGLRVAGRALDLVSE